MCLFPVCTVASFVLAQKHWCPEVSEDVEEVGEVGDVDRGVDSPGHPSGGSVSTVLKPGAGTLTKKIGS